MKGKTTKKTAQKFVTNPTVLHEVREKAGGAEYACCNTKQQ
jgi:hypothetical protein